MSFNDRRPLQNTPASARIIATANDRFGAVLSSLFSFWSARAAAIGSGGNAARRDAYSVILFNHGVLTAIENDFTSTPDQLLDALLPYEADGGTNYTDAIIHAQGLMERNWSTERYVLTRLSNRILKFLIGLLSLSFSLMENAEFLMRLCKTCVVHRSDLGTRF